MSTDRSGSTSEGQAGFSHLPVLLEQSIDLLDIRPGRLYVDATAGAGGHLARVEQELLKQGESRPNLLAIDRDNQSLDKLRESKGSLVKLAHANYQEIRKVLHEFGINTVSGGILADLGVSSMQLDNCDRGFSFMRDGPLDMRMDPSQSVTAAQLINNLSEHDLAEIIFRYGEERHSRLIAKNIVKMRPLHTTLELAEIVSRSISWTRKKGKKKGTSGDTSHPATRTFQAIRIAVNNELQSLEVFLKESIELLSPGARLAVITFHSLEDRLVKQIFRHAASECLCPPRQPICTCEHKRELLIITRKPVIADEKEVLANVRSRSAKLRAGEKLG